MLKRSFMFVALIVTLGNSAGLTTDKNIYNAGEKVTVTLTDMAKDQDWIGIFPQGAICEWENVVSWTWTEGEDEVILDGVPAGEYEARAFFNNSFEKEAGAAISVQGDAQGTTIDTNKDIYNAGEQISVTLTHMLGNEDWVGIYPVGANSDWNNMLSWAFTQGNNNVQLEGVAAGEYEARVFFNNSFNVEAIDAFRVEGNIAGTTIETNKEIYNAGEQISVTLTHMLGNQDWIGIYPVGTNSEWENIVSWAYTDGNDNLTLDGVGAGEYEVRVFFNNSFDVKAVDTITVNGGGNADEPTIYEDAEDGDIVGWVSHGKGTIQNLAPGYNSAHSINAGVVWSGFKLLSNYSFRKDNPWNNTEQKILKFEHRGNSACFLYGVKVNTIKGPRSVTWDAWFTHRHWAATKEIYADGNIELIFPTPGNVRSEHWTKHSYDIDEFIKRLEPDNRLLSVQYFYMSGGGQYDNIRLESE